MAGSSLLDTNIIIPFMASDPFIVSKIQSTGAVAVPSIVVGELYFGAYKSKQVEANLERIRELIKELAVIPLDKQTADIYGLLKNRLREKGRPIPENDIWIAAVALQYGLTLVTRDTHFSEVESLSLEIW